MTRHAPSDARRAQILEAAFQCFAERGTDARMDDIVRASGLSKGALYFHFQSKDEIFLALFEGYSAQMFSAWEAAEALEPLDALREQGDAALRTVLGAAPIVSLWVEFFRHPESRARMAAVYRESRERLAKTFRRGIEAGVIADCDVHAQAAALTALVEGLLLQSFVDPAFDPRPGWNESFAALARGWAP